MHARLRSSLAFALALVGAQGAFAQTTAAAAPAAATQGPSLVLPPRGGEVFRGVDGGVRLWWSAELSAAGVALVPSREVDAAVAALTSPEKPFVHGADASALVQHTGAGTIYATELSYDEGDVDVWMRAHDATGKPIAVGHAQGKLAKLGELLASAAAPLLKAAAARGEPEVARLSELALYERAAEALGQGRPADAVPLLVGVTTRTGDALRGEIAAAQNDSAIAPAERSRLASATGSNDRDWLQVRQGLIAGKDPALLMAGAANAEARDERERALELYQQASALAPDDLRAKVGTARMLSALDRHPEASAAWQSVLAASPGNADAYEALAKNPSLPQRARADYALELGALKAQRLDTDAAQASFERAGQLSPDVRTRARLETARLNARVGNDGDALMAYEELAALDPSQLGAEGAATFAGLGEARAASGDTQGAAAAYDRALAADPNQPVALEGKGELLIDAGKPAEAVPSLARAVELAPDDASARRALARAHHAAGNPDAALTALDASAVPIEERPKILLEAAEIQKEKGDLAAAQYSLEQAVAIAPDDAPLRSALARVYGESGNAEAAAREEARMSALTGVTTGGGTAKGAQSADGAATPKASEGFEALAASFPEKHREGTSFQGVVFLGLARDATWIEVVRDWLLPRTLDLRAVETELEAALGSRYALSPRGAVSEIAQPAYARVRDFSIDRADLSLVNDELGAEVTFVAKLTSPTPLALESPPGGPIKIDVRMHTGRTTDDVAILAVAMQLPSSAKYLRWNPRALLPYGLLLALIAAPFVRGWGRLNVRLEYEAKKSSKGFFSIVISRSPGKAKREREQSGAKSKIAVYQRKGGSWSRFARHMVGRETLFKLIPARTYYVAVHGIMQDDKGEVLGNYLEERKVKIPRGKTLEISYDFRPKEASLEVRLLRPEGDANGVVRVALRGNPSSLKFVKEDHAVFYVGPGTHVVVAGYGDCVYEREVSIHELSSQQISIGLGDPEQAVFRGCREAIEPFLMGDLALCARALDRAGMAQKANELRAKYHEQQGDKAEASRFYRAAGHLTQAAALAAETDDRAGSAELYEQAGDHRRAAESYLEAGDFAKAAQAFETAYAWSDAIEAYKRADDKPKVLELLERTGRHHEAGAISLQLGDEDRAIRNFQQVDLRDPDYGDACRALADLFVKREEWSLAVDRLREAVHHAGEEAAPLELWEQLGDALEKNGSLAEALQTFEGIRKKDYQYPGVADRIRGLREHVQALETQRQSQLQTLAAQTTQAAAAATAGPSAPVEDRYEILGELGRGGMGIVFKARDRRLGRVVALKRLPDNLRDHPTAVALFLREAQSAAALNHPNIVTIYDADQSNGAYYLTMEFLEGFPLDAILKKRGKLSAKDTLRMAAQISTGLQFAHERGLVHRDIKTANLFFTRDRVVKIMDFGLAKMVEEVRKAATVIGGTPYYMAPEQAAGERVDHRADLYAFGVTIFELLSGRVPFKDGDVTYHHRHTPPPMIAELAPDTPAELADLVMRMLEKQPSNRPATTAEVTAALEALLRRAD